MASIKIAPLQQDLPYGARISGITWDALEDPAVRQLIKEVFEDRGIIVFEDAESSGQMQVALSEVFGPLKDHPLARVERASDNLAPGVIELKHNPEDAAVVDLDGLRVSDWLPWHFDHCYNNELNRAGILRAIEIPPELGFTQFADGIQMHKALSPELQERIDRHNIVYSLDMRFELMPFGKPKNLVELVKKKLIYDLLPTVATMPRAIHPAVWTRASGEKVLHISPWMARGIENHEDLEGDALLTAVVDEMQEKMQPYVHHWKPTQMVAWDNWRLLHSVTGCDPKYSRCMHRTTIKGDYGLGYFEGNGIGNKILEMTV